MMAHDREFVGSSVLVEDYGKGAGDVCVFDRVEVWLSNLLPLWRSAGSVRGKASFIGVSSGFVLEGWWIE